MAHGIDALYICTYIKDHCAAGNIYLLDFPVHTEKSRKWMIMITQYPLMCWSFASSGIILQFSRVVRCLNFKQLSYFNGSDSRICCCGCTMPNTKQSVPIHCSIAAGRQCCLMDNRLLCNQYKKICMCKWNEWNYLNQIIHLKYLNFQSLLA